MRRIVWDEGLFRVLKRALASTAEDRALLDEERKSKGKGKGKSKLMREGSWTGASLENEQLMSALLADVAKQTVQERMNNPTMPKRERFKWHWSKQKFVIAEVKPSTWTDLDTRAAKLQWVGDCLTAISGTTIVVLARAC